MLDAAVAAWLIAQILKFVIVLIVNRKADLTRIWGAGGMPSSHSAFVVALATEAGKIYGISSSAFALAAALALIVMYDASSIRRSAGEHARIINYMMKYWSEDTPDFFTKQLKELLGHTPFQVIAGGILGFGIGLLI